MSGSVHIDDDLLRRLPLPLVQLYRRAENAKHPTDRHLGAFYLWEATLKLLASAAIVEFAQHPQPDEKLTESLRSLVRPSLGHWWQFVRQLVPVVAERNDGFAQLNDVLLNSRRRDDLPRLAGLNAALRERLEKQPAAQSAVALPRLLDRLANYRRVVIGHGNPATLGEAQAERLCQAFLLGWLELVGRVDLLAGRRLVYVSEIRQVGGDWLVQRLALCGEQARRIPSLELKRSQVELLPDGERVYLDSPPPEAEDETAAASLLQWRCLHPLLWFDPESEQAFFLNSRPRRSAAGRGRTEYLCYTTGQSVSRADLGGEQRRLLAEVLGMEVSESQAEDWAESLEADEPPEDAAAGEDEPQFLGDFELRSELGRGAMGVVYRAWQPSLRREVALKKLLRLGDDKTERRFRREIAALGRVEHPNLVKVFTSGAVGDQWFFAMELVEGAPLSDVCQKLQQRSSSASDVDLDAWQHTLSTVCEAVRRQEKPLSSHHDPRDDAPASGDETQASGDDAQASSDDAQASGPADPASQTPPGGERQPHARFRPRGREYVRRVVDFVRSVQGLSDLIAEQFPITPSHP